MDHEHKRGKIKDNALKALVTSELFRTRREENPKIVYKRKVKHRKKLFEDLN